MRKYLILTLAILLVPYFAGAASNSSESQTSPPDAFTPPSPTDMTAKCRTSELTQDKFLDMLRAVALHGDLTDIPFIEKTLGIKFKPLNPDTLHPSHQMYGGRLNGISMMLDFDTHGKELGGIKPEFGVSGSLQFNLLNAARFNFHDCGFLTKNAFLHKFDDFRDPTKKPPPEILEGGIGAGTIGRASAGVGLGKIGKDGTYIGIGSIYKIDGGVIQFMGITEQHMPEPTVRPK